MIGLVISFGITALLIKPLITALSRRNILDVPNERSSHTSATPKGAGIVVISVISIGWLLQATLFESIIPTNHVVIVSALSCAIALVSWIDDLKGLSSVFRLVAHFAAVIIALHLAPLPGLVFQGVFPEVVDTVLTAFTWVWFINLFNFMDGIDGIAGGQSSTICIGLILTGWLGADLAPLGPYASIVLGASLGLLVWNWYPAKIFLGDVGSAPLGFLLGGLLFSAAALGYWQVALILPGYYLTDATFTLIKRLLRGERVWQAHREHFYQKAVASGRSHRVVSTWVIACGLSLAVCAALNIIAFTTLSMAGSVLTIPRVTAIFLSHEKVR